MRPGSATAGSKPPVNPGRSWTSSVPKASTPTARLDLAATSTEFSQQSYGAHFAEVGVDMDTGEVRLRRMLGVFTAGRILNEKSEVAPDFGTSGLVGRSLLRMRQDGAEDDEDETED